MMDGMTDANSWDENSIGDLLKGETPASWSEAEEKVANVLRNRGAELLNVPPMVKFNI